MQTRKKSQRIERLSIAVNHDSDTFERSYTDEVALDMLSHTLTSKYPNMDQDEVIRKMIDDKFMPLKPSICSSGTLMFMRVYIRERINSFGVGRLAKGTDPAAQKTIEALDGVEVSPMDSIRKMSKAEHGETLDIIRKDLKNIADSGGDIEVPVMICQSDFTAISTPTEIGKELGDIDEAQWNMITPIPLKMFQESFTSFIGEVVRNMKKPIKISMFGDHQWVLPDSKLAKELKGSKKIGFDLQ